MIYIVDVPIDAGTLAHQLSQMRTWLDHMKFQPIGFRQIPGANIYRVDFEGEQEARAFAQAFAGQVLNRTAVQCRTPVFTASRRAMHTASGGKSVSTPSTT